MEPAGAGLGLLLIEDDMDDEGWALPPSLRQVLIYAWCLVLALSVADMALQLAEQLFIALCCAVLAAETGKAKAAATAVAAKSACRRMKILPSVWLAVIFGAPTRRC